MGLSENGCVKVVQMKRIWVLKHDEGEMKFIIVLMIGIFVDRIINEFNKKYIKSLLNFFI